MPAIKFNNGSVVKNTFESKSQPSTVTEVYLWGRFLKGIQYDFVNALETSDDEADEYIEFLKDLEVNGESLGGLQSTATDFKSEDYLNDNGAGYAIELADAKESEKYLCEKSNILSNLSEKNTNFLEALDGLQVPTTPSGEAMPLMVASNERVEGIHNLEKAKEMWGEFLGHIDVAEGDGTTSDESSDQKSDSDQTDESSVNDPTNIKGIGQNTIDTIERGGFAVVPDDVSKIEVEAFEFEKSDETTEQTMPEVTSKEVRDRYLAVKDEMSEFDEEIVQQRIIDGDLMDGLSIIEDYE